MSVVLSAILAQWNRHVLSLPVSGLSWNTGLSLAFYSALFSFGAIALSELISPDTLSPTWRISGIAGRVVTYFLALLAALAGVSSLIARVPTLAAWALGGLGVGQLVYRRSWTARPVLDALLRYTIIFGVIMGLAVWWRWLIDKIPATSGGARSVYHVDRNLRYDASNRDREKGRCEMSDQESSSEDSQFWWRALVQETWCHLHKMGRFRIV